MRYTTLAVLQLVISLNRNFFFPHSSSGETIAKSQAWQLPHLCVAQMGLDPVMDLWTNTLLPGKTDLTHEFSRFLFRRNAKSGLGKVLVWLPEFRICKTRRYAVPKVLQEGSVMDTHVIIQSRRKVPPFGKRPSHTQPARCHASSLGLLLTGSALQYPISTRDGAFLAEIFIP